jgi:hypothetical protein
MADRFADSVLRSSNRDSAVLSPSGICVASELTSDPALGSENATPMASRRMAPPRTPAAESLSGSDASSEDSDDSGAESRAETTLGTPMSEGAGEHSAHSDDCVFYPTVAWKINFRWGSSLSPRTFQVIRSMDRLSTQLARRKEAIEQRKLGRPVAASRRGFEVGGDRCLSLVWAAEGVNEKSIALGAPGVHIVRGHVTQAVLRALKGRHASRIPMDCCVSVVADSRTVDMVFNSSQEATQWYHGLQRAIRTARGDSDVPAPVDAFASPSALERPKTPSTTFHARNRRARELARLQSTVSKAQRAAQLEELRTLLSQGVDPLAPTGKGKRGDSLLTAACRRGNTPLVEATVTWLLSGGASAPLDRPRVDLSSTQAKVACRQAVRAAVKHGRNGCLKLLMRLASHMGVRDVVLSAHDEDERGRSLLLLAAARQHNDVVRTLGGLGAIAASDRDADGSSALHLCCGVNDAPCLSVIHAAFASDPASSKTSGAGGAGEAMDAAGRPGSASWEAALGAVDEACASLVEAVLERVSSDGDREELVNSVDTAGRCPLHLASSSGLQQTCEVLVTHGADCGVLDHLGRSPQDCAARGGFSALAKFLRELSGPPSSVKRPRAREEPGDMGSAVLGEDGWWRLDGWIWTDDGWQPDEAEPAPSATGAAPKSPQWVSTGSSPAPVMVGEWQIQWTTLEDGMQYPWYVHLPTGQSQWEVPNPEIARIMNQPWSNSVPSSPLPTKPSLATPPAAPSSVARPSTPPSPCTPPPLEPEGVAPPPPPPSAKPPPPTSRAMVPPPVLPSPSRGRPVVVQHGAADAASLPAASATRHAFDSTMTSIASMSVAAPVVPSTPAAPVAPVAPAAPAAPAALDESLLKFAKMLKMGVPAGAVRAKMSQEGLSGEALENAFAAISASLSAPSAPSAPVVPAAPVVPSTPAAPAALDESLLKFAKMLKMGVPAGAVRAKMSQEGMSGEALENAFNAVTAEWCEQVPEPSLARNTAKPKPPSKSVPTIASLADDPKLGRFVKMSRVGIPPAAVAAKMATEGLTEVEQMPLLLALGLRTATEDRTSSSTTSEAHGPRFRQLHWEPVASENSELVSKSVFGQVAGDQGPSGASLEADDLETLASLFAISAPSAQGKAVTTKSSSPAKAQATSVRLLDFKRSNNVSIGLAQFKKLREEPLATNPHVIGFPYQRALIRSILRADRDAVPLERLETVVEMLPSPQEVTLLAKAPNPPSSFEEAEAFLWRCGLVQRMTNKVRGLVALWQASTVADEVQKEASTLIEACDVVTTSDALKKLVAVVLAVGNAMNRGTAKGGAVAFRLESFLRLGATKAADGKTTLLDYVVQTLMKQDPALPDQAVSHLKAASAARRIPLSELHSRCNTFSLALTACEREASTEMASVEREMAASPESSEAPVEEESPVPSGDGGMAAMLAEIRNRGKKSKPAVAPRRSPVEEAEAPSFQDRKAFVDAIKSQLPTALAHLERMRASLKRANDAAGELAVFFAEDPSATNPSKVLETLTRFATMLQSSLQAVKRRNRASAKSA